MAERVNALPPVCWISYPADSLPRVTAGGPQAERDQHVHYHSGGSLTQGPAIRRCWCGEPVILGRRGWRTPTAFELWRHRRDLRSEADWILGADSGGSRWHWWDWLRYPRHGLRQWRRWHA